MKETKEQISEEFADKLLFNSKIEGDVINLIKKDWKDHGYIRQSKEEDIREEIQRVLLSGRVLTDFECSLLLLIDILDKEIDDKKPKD